MALLLVFFLLCVPFFGYGELVVVSPSGVQNFTIDTVGIAALSAAFSNFTNILYMHNGDGCDYVPDASGRIVMLDFGLCKLQDQANNVMRAGGVGMIIVSTTATSYIFDTIEKRMAFPCVSINVPDGEFLRALTTNVVVQITQSPTIPLQLAALQAVYTATQGPTWNDPEPWDGKKDICQQFYRAIKCNDKGAVTFMQLNGYGLNGTLPPQFSDLTDLELFDFSNNQLSGTIPDLHGFHSLFYFILFNNNFTGTIPESLAQLPLVAIMLSNNHLYGTIPDIIFNAGFTALHIASNDLTGELPSTISNLTQIVDVGHNKLSGTIPDYADCALLSFYISNNAFSGTFPSLANCKATLQLLRLGSNNFVGTVPQEIIDFQQLNELDISNNNFIDPLPDLPFSLVTLLASNNRFSTLPPSFYLMENLITIDFSHNSINQSLLELYFLLPIPMLPGKSLQNIDFSHNHITTLRNQLELGLDNWPNLNYLKLNNNKMTGRMQPILFGFDLTPNLKSVDISNNFLDGPLPPVKKITTKIMEFRYDNNSFFHGETLLPEGFVPDYINLVDFPKSNFTCPTIRWSSGTVVVIDESYHEWLLCKCYNGFRKVMNSTSVSNRKEPPFACVACPFGMVCNNANRTNDELYSIEPHYYPTPEYNPKQLLHCPNCAGSTNNGTVVCNPYHHGRLCSHCDKNSFLQGTSCKRCAPVGSFIISMSIIMLCIMLIGFVLYNLMQRRLIFPSLLASRDIKKNIVNGKEKVSKENAIAIILIGINYYQTVSALTKYYGLPNTITRLVSAIKVISEATGAGLGIECLHTSLLEYKNMYTAIMLEPVLCLGAAFALYLFGKVATICIQNKPTALNEWGITCFRMSLFAINILFFPVTSAAIDAFRCTKDPETGKIYNSRYAYASCDDVSLGARIIALILYGGGVMAFFSFLVIYYHKKRLDNKPGTLAYIIQQSFGFFFLHFRDRYYWFALAVLFRRFAISLVSSLVRLDSIIAFCLNTSILFASAIYVVIYRPFRTHIDNMLEIVTVLCTCFVYSLSVLMIVPEYKFGIALAEVIYFFVNITVLLWCGFELLKGMFFKIKTKYLNNKVKVRDEESVASGVDLDIRSSSSSDEKPN